MSSLFGKKRKRNSTKRRRDNDGDDENIVDLPINDNSKNNGNFQDSKNPSHQKAINSNTDDDNDDNLVLQSTRNLSFDELGLDNTLVSTCRSMGFVYPTKVQQVMIPYLISSKQQKKENILCLSATGSGKTAAFCLPILQRLSHDPYGIYATILTPTRELAKQIHQQIMAFSPKSVDSVLVVGGLDLVAQACKFQHSQPHFVIATPGRLAALLRGPPPHPRLKYVRYLVLDEADRLLTPHSGFEDDVLLIQKHIQKGQQQQQRKKDLYCQTLLFSATMTQSLSAMEKLATAGAGNEGRLPLKKIIIQAPPKQEEERMEDNSDSVQEEEESDDDDATSNSNIKSKQQKINCIMTPTLPAGLKQEYIFMPSRVRDAYLVTAIRNLIQNGGRRRKMNTPKRQRIEESIQNRMDSDDDDETEFKARLAIIFVSSCRRAAFVSTLLNQLGVDTVTLHSLLSQRRRLASVAKFQSHHTRIMVATDVASRGLDIPLVDLVINAELPRRIENYVHRVGRTARAGRRGLALSLVSETDINLVHAIESSTHQKLNACSTITDDMALKLLGPTTKAARMANMKLMEIGFDELEQKIKERKRRDRNYKKQQQQYNS